MRPVSAGWASALAGPHQLSIAVTVVDPRTDTETPLTASGGDDGSLVDGSVTLDANASVRGRCALTVRGVDMIPTAAEDLLAPYCNEVRVERGYTTPSGVTERVTLGTFRIEDSDVSGAPGDLSVSINGLDRAQRMSDAKFEVAGTIAAGTTFSTAILSLLQDAWPDMPYDFTTTTRVTPLLVFAEQEDRWEGCQQMAKAVGMDLYFDGDGTCVLKPYSPGSAVADLIEGDGGLLLDAGRTWTRQGSFNKVIATGENPTSGAIYRGEALDDDATSPTYYYGPFGSVPRFYSSPYIVSDAQADDAAATILLKELGTTQQVSWSAVPNPALEPNDVVRVTRSDLVDQNLILDSLTIPLSAEGVMTGSTRAVTIQ